MRPTRDCKLVLPYCDEAIAGDNILISWACDGNMRSREELMDANWIAGKREKEGSDVGEGI